MKKVYFVTLRKPTWIKEHGIEAELKKIDPALTPITKKVLSLVAHINEPGTWIFIDKGHTLKLRNRNRFVSAKRKQRVNTVVFDANDSAEKILEALKEARSKK